MNILTERRDPSEEQRRMMDMATRLLLLASLRLELEVIEMKLSALEQQNGLGTERTFWQQEEQNSRWE